MMGRMESFLKSIFLGFLQGITEFLPVSSSGHLALTQAFFDFENFFLLTLTVHFGTLFSIIIFYRKEIWLMFQELFTNPLEGLFLKIIVSSLPVLIVGFFFYNGIKEIFNHLAYVGMGFVLTASFLLSTYKFRKEKINQWSQISYIKSLEIGIFQILALIPGVSRSGMTICTGIILGLKPSLAVSFSFLMALPTLTAACILEFSKTSWNSELALPFLGSFLSAFIFGYLALQIMKETSSYLYRFSFYLYPLAVMIFISYLL